MALVTGTNSWDLHGSQTYYFDNFHKLQRITFRGWTGDSTRLVQMLTDVFKFESRPTSLAGLYTATKGNKRTGAAMMKHPSVIYSENPVQQLGVVLEINNQDGPFSLSRDFLSLIQGSH